MSYNKSLLSNLEKQPRKIGMELSIKQLEKIILDASKYYYSSDVEIISDKTFDIIQDILREKKPKSKVLENIGSMEPSINKIKLPYHMGSMNKIKPNSKELNNYLSKFKGPFVISEKLDGLSGLLVCNLKQSKMSLYSRGDGSNGQNLSGLLNNINLFTNKKNNLVDKCIKNGIHHLVIRGEIIMKKDIFNKKYKALYSKGRSLVAGTCKKQDPSIVKDMDYVSYEIIEPNLKPNEQFTILKNLGLIVANNEVKEIVNNDILKKTLIEYKSKSNYEIDGIIITDNSKKYPPNESKNPEHSVAFKMLLDEQMKETTITHIEYNASKHGVLIPTIKYKEIIIGGDKFTATTGFYAKYIKDNKLGPGAIIKIVISGDVIPYVAEIVKSAKEWQAPSKKDFGDFEWNSSGLQLVLKNKDDNLGVRLKRLTHFFTTLEIEGMGPGNIERLYKAGYDTVNKIIKVTPDLIAQIDGYQIKSALKIYKSIHSITDKPIELSLLMTASNTFGQGFGVRKIKPVIMKYPNLMEKSNIINKNNLLNVNGYSEKSAISFIDGFRLFKEWLNDHPNLKFEIKKATTKVKKNGKMNNQVVVFTGVRDNELEDKIMKEGGTIGSDVNSKTTLLIAKDPNNASGKVNKARKLEIKIISLEDAKKQIC